LLFVGSSEWSEESSRYVDTAELFLYEGPSCGERRTFSQMGYWDSMEVVKKDGEEAKGLKLFEGCELETFDLV
jgi:hypothetical protein